VSVVMATFQGERFLPEQLQSLTEQSRLPDELIVVDDHSTDATVAILEDFAREAPFDVEVVARGRHNGTAETFGEAMRRATGDILMICDQDDRWLPPKVATLAATLADHPAALLAFSDSRLIDAHGEELSPSRWRIAGFGRSQIDGMKRDPFGAMLARQIVAGCSAAIRASLVPALLPCPVGVHEAMPDMIYDRWMSLAAAAAGPVIPVEDRLLDYRIHRSQQLGISKLPLRRLSPRFVLNAGQLIPPREEMRHRILWTDEHLREIDKRLARLELGGPATEERITLAQRHLARREALAPRRASRVASVVSEYRSSDGYRRFSLGVSTALADLLR
jgi:glycosyltransferase involved in cell wall biosynthesis